MRLIYTNKWKKKRKSKKTKSRIQKYADQLNKDLPTSELWFQGLFKGSKYSKNTNYNKPLGKYIPDAINKTLMIIIEVDGSIHDTEDQKLRDKDKDLYYFSKGYKVFRIKAFSSSSYNQFLKDLDLYIEVIKEYRNLKAFGL